MHHGILLESSKQLCSSFSEPAGLSQKMVPCSSCYFVCYSYTWNKSVLPRVFTQITTQYLSTIFSFKISKDRRAEAPRFLPRYRHWPLKAMQLESKNPWISQHSLNPSQCLVILEVPELTLFNCSKTLYCSWQFTQLDTTPPIWK